MHTTLAAICGLQQKYSSSNTPEMQERGRLVKHRRQLEAIKPAKAPGQDSIGTGGQNSVGANMDISHALWITSAD